MKILAVLLITVGLAVAGYPPEASDVPFRQVAVTAAAGSLGAIGATPPSQTPSLGVVVMLSVHGAAVRVRFDGQEPTATTGHLIPTGSFMVWPLATARKARFIRPGDTDAVIAITEGAL